MAVDGLYISGYFSEDDKPMIAAYADELKAKDVRFYVRNLSGTIMHAAFDFADFEVMAITYGVLQQFIINGGYDATKYFFKKLWWNITKDRKSNLPFTISIEGIPTKNGIETVKCKIQGQMSDDEKEMVIDKTFLLASQIEMHQYQLMERSQYYNALDGHLFRYDSNSKELYEVDIKAELQKMAKEK